MTTEPQRPPGPMSPDAVITHDARTLLTDAQFASVVGTVLDNNTDMTVDMAERIVIEGIRFVATGALRPELATAPSRIVDEGWHALILHTELYAQLCARFGPFVHHTPGYDPDNYDPDIMARTLDAITACGFEVDAELWRAPTDNGLVSVTAGCSHAPSKDGPIKPMPTPQPPCRKSASVA